MAKTLASETLAGVMVIPDVDGGLIFALKDKDGNRHIVRLKYEDTGEFEKRTCFEKGTTPRALMDELENLFSGFVSVNHHPLMDFEGQDIQEIVLEKGEALQEVWSRYLEEGTTRWGPYVLERLESRSGALYLVFGGKDGSVGLRISDREDPRLALSQKVLFIRNLALSIVDDRRKPSGNPLTEVERFVAYLLVHTTGPSTRIRGKVTVTPDVTLFAKDTQVNQFLPEGRQGASGMMACLAGRKSGKLAVLAVGDASCRQTFPPVSRLRFFDTWSYFPVRTAPPPGGWKAVDFSENDVITGSEQKLHDALEEVKGKNKNTKVALIQTCVSALVGDDAAGVVESVLDKKDCVILNPDFQSRQLGVDGLLWPWVFKAFRPPRKQQKKPGFVNLVGFGRRDFTSARELEALLGRFGIGVNALLFPSFDEKDIPLFGSAPVTVCNTCSIVKNAFARVLEEDSASRWIFPDPPFGLKATRIWVERVFEAVRGKKRSKKIGRELDDLYRDFLKRLAPLTHQLKQVSMAVVSSGRFCSFLFNSSEIFGIPVFDVASELGITVEVFIFEDVSLPGDLADKVGAYNNVNLHVFKSADKLVDSLRSSEAKLLLTSIRRNGFALSVKKVPITIHTFEMGFEGGLRTARRLAFYSGFDFVERYHRYLRT